jgi:hypothetical protein
MKQKHREPAPKTGINSPRLDTRVVTDRDIAQRAYEKFVARGRIHGFDQEDWAAAQRELFTEAGEAHNDAEAVPGSA